MDHYDILEVSPKASAEVIRAAYKSLMQRNHPDKNADALESTTARAALIAQAYAVLSDPQQRRSYDESRLQGLPAERSPGGLSRGGSSASPWGRQGGRTTSASWRTWYGTALVISIICAGGAILVLSKRSAAPAAAVQESRPPLPRANETQLVANDAERSVRPASTAALSGAIDESAAELQARTISSFVTDLSIELASSDPAPTSAAHVLHIPNLGLRFTQGQAGLAQRIEEQRSAVIQQLLTTLGKAEYQELIKPDGDLYLKKLIEQAVCAGICLDESAALSSAVRSTQSQKLPLDALLPLSFSVR